MKFFKKNQVIVAVIGLMLIAAGYLNFTNQEGNEMATLETGALADAEEMAGIGDATLVSAIPSEIQNDTLKGEIDDTDKTENMVNETTNSVETNTIVVTDEYFTQSRLERETMYSKRLASYQEIMEKTTVSETQKATAQKEIDKINDEQNAIMITENLLKTKGFEDLIIFINDESINVIVKASKLETDQIAQIQNIITRELKADIENIHITNKE